MDDEQSTLPLPESEGPMDERPDNEVIPEETMEERRRGVANAPDIMDSGHSRSVERRTVENIMEDSYLRYP